jgi:hypothetical protein
MDESVQRLYACETASKRKWRRVEVRQIDEGERTSEHEYCTVKFSDLQSQEARWTVDH